MAPQTLSVDLNDQSSNCKYKQNDKVEDVENDSETVAGAGFS